MQQEPRESISNAFFERYGYLREYTKSSLRKFIESPNKKNVHDIRRDFRRLNASFGSLPGRYLDEHSSIQKYVKKSKQVLKQTSKVRDIDIIREKLELRTKDAHAEALISSLKGIRADQIKKLMRNAVKLSKKSIPTLTSLKSVDLENSIDGATLRLNSDIVDYLLTVLEDPDDIEALHSLRKSVRDLRYTLEMLPGIKRTRREISTLTKWQGTLGDVIDSAVIESYLGTLPGTDLHKTWAHQERTKRHQKYREFLNIYEKSKTLILK